MKADSIIILILVFTVITIAIGGIIGDMRTYYDVNASTSWENKYNFANEINESVSGMSEASLAAGTEKGWLASIIAGGNAFLVATVTTVKLIINVPGYTISMIRGIASDLGLPPIVSDLIIPIFIVMIIVTMIFIAVRFLRGENV